MSQSTRLRDIIAILEARHLPVPVEVFLDELSVSLSSFKRDIGILRDQMQAPISWKAGNAAGHERGYILEDKGWGSGKLGLPRAWFTDTEIYALLMIDELANHIGPGLLTEHLQPLITRITLALSAADDAPQDIRSRVRILASASKRKQTPHFETVAKAAVKRQRLSIVYFTRSRNERSERVVSPQRMVHYKENWYLIAWCHTAEGLRMFALDAIEGAQQISKAARSVAKIEVDEMIGRDFGIYAGQQRLWAKLLFSPIQARWVEAEVWHSEQKSSRLDDGSYLLEIPYGNPKELILEILRFGPDVKVIGPASLRDEVRKRLQSAVDQYH